MGRGGRVFEVRKCFVRNSLPQNGPDRYELRNKKDRANPYLVEQRPGQWETLLPKSVFFHVFKSECWFVPFPIRGLSDWRRPWKSFSDPFLKTVNAHNARCRVDDNFRNPLWTVATSTGTASRKGYRREMYGGAKTIIIIITIIGARVFNLQAYYYYGAKERGGGGGGRVTTGTLISSLRRRCVTRASATRWRRRRREGYCVTKRVDPISAAFVRSKRRNTPLIGRARQTLGRLYSCAPVRRITAGHTFFSHGRSVARCPELRVGVREIKVGDGWESPFWKAHLRPRRGNVRLSRCTRLIRTFRRDFSWTFLSTPYEYGQLFEILPYSQITF